ncbi:MAG: PSD1 and planctomycete cytochrome C domain-containing protein [Fuerstiella sp.]
MQILEPTNRLPLRALIAVAVAAGCTGGFADEQEDFFERQIRPLLAEHCVSCHGPDKQEGDLRLDSRQQVLQGSADVAALVVPGNPQDSRLLQVILYDENDVQMPPRASLPQARIAMVKHWIESGAFWPAEHSFGQAKAVDPEAWRRHWAFQPIVDAPPPDHGSSDSHPIDAFVRDRLKQLQLEPSPMADGRTLARRLSYAITGLPPQLDDLRAAEAINSDSERDRWLSSYTDQLLASPQFGERWARYWLDISRYADTKGYVFTDGREYANAWQFRQWVIRSLNDDMPYDEFLRWQIAGDRMAHMTEADKLAAMGFLTLGRRFLNNKHDIIDDRIDVLTRGTMALTVTCARCHDHKFDPIPTADYYSLYGVFDSSDEPLNGPSTLRLSDREQPREPVIFVRGSPGNRGERVTRHFLTALSDGEPQPFTDGSGRLELANKIASADNPLTARVAVNRIWMRLFGTGLVDSPSDFGVRTPPPSHPELLDHLAAFFIRNNWSRKAVIRYIVTSQTWRQSSQPRPDAAKLDPENRLLTRSPRRRLDFEAFRDSLLSAAGTLDTTVGGTSVDITARPYSTRRTVYARIDRQNLPGLFRTFDFASPDNHAPRRFETTVPQQALFQLNSPFVMEQARHIGRRASKQSGPDAITSVYLDVLQRTPRPDELQVATSFLQDAAAAAPSSNQGFGWQYGWGEISEQKSSVLQFQRLPVFHENRWGGGTELPDPQLGWCMLTATGGHAGGDRKHCTIRRWVADQDSLIRIDSRLKHANSDGDGVTGLIIAPNGLLASAQVHNQSQPIPAAEVSVVAGDTIDFVIDCGANESHDSFEWRITIQQSVDGRKVRDWQSDREFSGAQPAERLQPLEQLAQTLLLTNEFMFVD